MSYAGPQGDHDAWKADPELPIAGSVEVAMPVEALWEVFRRCREWPTWNSCFWRASVTGGILASGQTLVWAFNPIRRRYMYKLPAIARLAEVIPGSRVTWEVTLLPGFYARHTYWMEAIDERHCRFGSWEVAEGAMFRGLRRFWLAHFRFVCQASLAGARNLAD